jgi:hypothetical protein
MGSLGGGHGGCGGGGRRHRMLRETPFSHAMVPSLEHLLLGNHIITLRGELKPIK